MHLCLTRLCKCKIQKEKKEAYLVFLVTGGDVLLDPFGLQSLV